MRESDCAMRRSAAALLVCCTATATALTALKEPKHREGATTPEEPAWLRRQLRPEDESISRKKAGQKGVAGGPCYPGKTECPFSTSCEWDRDTEDGEELCGNQPRCRVHPMTRPSWLGRAVKIRHRHAIEQASRRRRGGRRDDSARTRRKTLIPTQAKTFESASANIKI